MQITERIQIDEDENNINNEIQLNSAERSLKVAFIYAEIFNKNTDLKQIQ